MLPHCASGNGLSNRPSAELVLAAAEGQGRDNVLAAFVALCRADWRRRRGRLGSAAVKLRGGGGWSPGNDCAGRRS